MVNITAGPSSNSQSTGETDTELTYTVPSTSLNENIYLSISTDSIDTVEPQTDITLPGGGVNHWGSNLNQSPGQNLGPANSLIGKKVRVYTTLTKSVDPGHEASLIYKFLYGTNPVIQANVKVTGKNPTQNTEFFYTTIIFNQA